MIIASMKTTMVRREADTTLKVKIMIEIMIGVAIVLMTEIGTMNEVLNMTKTMTTAVVDTTNFHLR